MSEQETNKFVMPEAATVSVEKMIGGETKEKTFDIYDLRAVIVEGDEDHGEDGNERFQPLRQMVADGLGIDVGKVALNQVIDLRDYVLTTTNRLHDERKKKYSSTANSPVSTQDYPILSGIGQREKNEPGLTTPLL